MNKDAKLEFKNKYIRMHQDRKWKLSSGKYVEDVLYEYVKNLVHERISALSELITVTIYKI
ncbi:hypothetical protein BC937DRAFT_93145 [Endogone sp. FLAS-F59071]|nr:hypothetical protein BC937DRAFT_93145 [Endogone sp. FLAS-F59071]|eukprot:RUS21266.1 hypothetical protein BC937DRAFT_93145 [Endogone sp. FLAS-F59071]